MLPEGLLPKSPQTPRAGRAATSSREGLVVRIRQPVRG
jgi:hypothetical protein